MRRSLLIRGERPDPGAVGHASGGSLARDAAVAATEPVIGHSNGDVRPRSVTRSVTERDAGLPIPGLMQYGDRMSAASGTLWA